jgi:hypothetical protein
MPWSLYPQGKSRQHPLDKSLGGAQSRSGRREVQKTFYPYWESNPDRSTSYWVEIVICKIKWSEPENKNLGPENA